jgi:hypothetical protein
MAVSRNYSANITGSFWKRILTQCVKRFLGYMGIYCYGRVQTMLHCGIIYLKMRIMFGDLCLLFVQKFTLTFVRYVSYFGPILAKICIARYFQSHSLAAYFSEVCSAILYVLCFCSWGYSFRYTPILIQNFTGVLIWSSIYYFTYLAANIYYASTPNTRLSMDCTGKNTDL